MSSTDGDRTLPTREELYCKAEHVLELAAQHRLTVGTAESCTGGLVAAELTEVPGSSAVVRGGVVSYAIPVKHARSLIHHTRRARRRRGFARVRRADGGRCPQGTRM